MTTAPHLIQAATSSPLGLLSNLLRRRVTDQWTPIRQRVIAHDLHPAHQHAATQADVVSHASTRAASLGRPVHAPLPTTV